MGIEGGGHFEARMERPRGLDSLERRLDEMALERGHEAELATSERSAEWILFQRMLYILIEESQEWDPLQRAKLRSVIAAFGASAFSRFTHNEQYNFRDNFSYMYEEEPLDIDRPQARALSELGARVGIDIKPEPRTISFKVPETETQRITEVEDPEVTKILQEAPEDVQEKAAHLLKIIGNLTLRQKIKLLLSLPDEAYEAFKKRRKAGFSSIVEEIMSNQDLIPDKVERIRAISQLRDATPRYEVEADIRRNWDGRYPTLWDEDIEEDPQFKPDDGLPRLKGGKRITYQQAIEQARFEFARKFYRNSFFPQVARTRNPQPISFDSIHESYQAYKEGLPKDKPGTDISTKHLLDVVKYYLDYEPDNEENCEIHRKVQSLAELIAATEEALEG